MTPETYTFVRWGAPHIVVIILTLLCTTCIIAVGKLGSDTARQRLSRGMAVFLALMFTTEFTWRFSGGNGEPWQQNLPLHFCSVMIIISCIALWYRKHWACALVYFGVLTASVQGLITPALDLGFPHFTFFIFFISHSSLFLAAVGVVFLLRWRARRKDFVRSLLFIDAYLVGVIPLNLLLGTNYCFTQESPVPGCILDYLGSAPWYYLWLQLPVLGVFWLMYLPVRQRP